MDRHGRSSRVVIRETIQKLPHGRLWVPPLALVVLYSYVGNPLKTIYYNYCVWHAMGRGGIPSSPLGWTVQTILQLLHFRRRDMRSLDEYESTYALSFLDARATTAYLETSLPPKSSRPLVPGWFIPQRQAKPGSSPQLREMQLESLHKIIQANSHIVEYRDSKLEGGGPAIFIKDTSKLPRGMGIINGELVHCHHVADGSYHMTLSAADAKEVVEKKWGQRHAASGSAIVLLPLGYTMVYAPQNEDDVQVIGEIIRASLRYLTGEDVA